MSTSNMDVISDNDEEEDLIWNGKNKLDTRAYCKKSKSWYEWSILQPDCKHSALSVYSRTKHGKNVWRSRFNYSTKNIKNKRMELATYDNEFDAHRYKFADLYWWLDHRKGYVMPKPDEVNSTTSKNKQGIFITFDEWFYDDYESENNLDLVQDEEDIETQDYLKDITLENNNGINNFELAEGKFYYAYIYITSNLVNLNAHKYRYEFKYRR